MPNRSRNWTAAATNLLMLAVLAFTLIGWRATLVNREATLINRELGNSIKAEVERNRLMIERETADRLAAERAKP